MTRSSPVRWSNRAWTSVAYVCESSRSGATAWDASRTAWAGSDSCAAERRAARTAVIRIAAAVPRP
jgi:hypothetical protein